MAGKIERFPQDHTHIAPLGADLLKVRPMRA
jgi:hypothetical protein